MLPLPRSGGGAGEGGVATLRPPPYPPPLRGRGARSPECPDQLLRDVRLILTGRPLLHGVLPRRDHPASTTFTRNIRAQPSTSCNMVIATAWVIAPRSCDANGCARSSAPNRASACRITPHM